MAVESGEAKRPDGMADTEQRNLVASRPKEA